MFWWLFFLHYSAFALIPFLTTYQSVQIYKSMLHLDARGAKQRTARGQFLYRFAEYASVLDFPGN